MMVRASKSGEVSSGRMAEARTSLRNGDGVVVGTVAVPCNGRLPSRLGQALEGFMVVRVLPALLLLRKGRRAGIGGDIDAMPCKGANASGHNAVIKNT